MLQNDTIVAPATPPGEGGVAVVRLSGPGAQGLLKKTFPARAPEAMRSHHLYHGMLQDPNDRVVDEVLAVVMRAPRSYTGEDVVEIHCHGGTQILRTVLDLFLTLGARLAEPGEFTQRAFLNGRLDLTQAEAVAALIGARSEQSRQVALGQLEGRLSRQLHQFSDQLKTLLALVEAHIDFPDDEVGALDLAPLVSQVAAVGEQVAQLTVSFDSGRILREGLSLLILGRPNVGKSSLMNALLGEARAIVTEVPGTTRDTLEERLVLGGFPVRLVDTAGVRETDDPIEREGVQRARDKVMTADLVLLVVDGSVPEQADDLLAASLCTPERTLLVVNKCDQTLCAEPALADRFPNKVSVSAKQEVGLDELQAAVVALLGRGNLAERADDVIVTERRHLEALLRAEDALQRFSAAAAQALPLECLAVELRDALAALGAITGETTPDEILEQIFSRFCIGK